MDLTLIPLRDSFLEFLVYAKKSWTVLRPHYFRDTSPCDEVAHGVCEWISVHTLGNFPMYGSGSQTCEQDSITLNLTSGSLDPKRTKTINAHKTEWGFVRCDSVNRKVGHLLSSKQSLTSPTTKTISYNSPHCDCSFCNPVALSDQREHIFLTRMSRKQMVMPDDPIYNVMFLWQYYRMSLLLFDWCVPRSSPNSQQAIAQLRIQLGDWALFLDRMCAAGSDWFLELNFWFFILQTHQLLSRAAFVHTSKTSISAECISSTLMGLDFLEMSA